MKSLATKATLLFAIAGALSLAAHADDKTSWGAYRSIVNPSVEIDDSFNRTTKVDNTVSTDKSRRTDNSFNRTNDNDTTVDASRHASNSFNRSLDVQTVAPSVYSTKSIATLDTQTANNSAQMSGATQVGHQGGFALNMGGGSPASADAKYFSRAASTQSYDIGQANEVKVGGDNLGSIRNQNYLNLGGSQIVDSDLGNKQIFSAGPQTQVQGVSQDKTSATQTHASDTVTTTTSK